MKDKYAARGVAAGKEDVHAAISHLDKGEYPTAFCKILPDYVGNDPDFCNLMHADTAGTKTALAYMYYKETGDLSVWKGVVQDAIVMNTDDMACVGCLDSIMLSSTIGRNKHLIDREVLATLISATNEFIEQMKVHGSVLYLAGGETADVGDIVRTVDVGFTAFARMRRSDLVVNNIQPRQVIVGLASYGQSTYEQEYNSGIGSNGLTMARHELFGGRDYISNYPDTYAAQTPLEYIYSGSRRLTDQININDNSYPLGKLALSPTRTYLPVLKVMLAHYRAKISGIIHNTGGAHTKVIKYLSAPVLIVKDNLLPTPLIFNIIKESASTSLEEMYRVFNMGTRLEIYTDPITATELIKIAQSFNIEAQVIGRVEEATKTSVEVHCNGEILKYS